MHKISNSNKIPVLGYKMTNDSGFAPNPFHGYMTLATCKPTIRRTRAVGDWIAGFSSRALVNAARKVGVNIKPMSLIFLMEITEKPISFDDYFLDSRFRKKKPDLNYQDLVNSCGDNIYHTNSSGKIIQTPNKHHSIENQDHDLNGKYVLISNNYFYFGRHSIFPNEGWSQIIDSELSSGRTFYCPENFLEAILLYLKQNGIRPGRHGAPCLWADQTAITC